MLLETKGIAGVLAFEWRDQVLAAMAAFAAVISCRIAPKKLAWPQTSRSRRRVPCRFVPSVPCLHGRSVHSGWTRATANRLRNHALAEAMVAGDHVTPFRQIDVDGDVGQGHPWQFARILVPVSTVDPSADQPIKSFLARKPPQSLGVAVKNGRALNSRTDRAKNARLQRKKPTTIHSDELP